MIRPVSMSVYLEVRICREGVKWFSVILGFGIFKSFQILFSGSFALGEIPLRIITCFRLGRFRI